MGSGEVAGGRARVGAGPPRPLQCQGNQMVRAACQFTPGGADTTSIIVRRQARGLPGHALRHGVIVYFRSNGLWKLPVFTTNFLFTFYQ